MNKDKQDSLYNSHYFCKKSSGGYTLIELIISIGVFTIGIMGVLGLSISNYYDAQNIINRNIAINLAREGIELIRNVRDSNWLKMDNNVTCDSNPCTWNSGLDSTFDYSYIDYGESEPTFLTAACGGTTEFCVGNYTETRLYLNLDQYYYHDISAPPSGTVTKYSRGIKLSRICLNSDIEISQGDAPDTFEYVRNMSSSCDGGGDSQIGLQVLAHVQWEDEGSVDYIEMVDSIYNWRK